MIKNLVFDVGDVLIEFRWRDMLLEHGLTEEKADEIGEKLFDNEIWAGRLDTGIIGIQGAIEEFGKLYPDDREVISWFMNHGELMVVHRPELWPKIKKLKEMGYRIYLLSNYSKELFEKHTREAKFIEYLDGEVVSYQVGMIKPDRNIYLKLLEKYNLLAEECLFFDDRLGNVQGAEAVGIGSIHVTSREQLNQCLDNLVMNS